MFNSVMQIKSLPDETKIFCGHEYTEDNLKFCLAFDKQNNDLKDKALEIKNLRKKGLPTIPTDVLSEKKNNIFFRCDNPEISANLEMRSETPEKIFEKLRELKDNF